MSFVLPLVPQGPLAAVLLLLGGAVLLLLELHRPGRVLPGTVGLLAVLLGARGLTLAGATRPGLLLVVAGAGLLLGHALLRRRAVWLGTAGAVLFAAGMLRLPATGGWAVRLVAGAGGALLGGGMAWLGAMAGLARRNKQVHARASAEVAARGDVERWEPRGR